jgi:hypothetical protein
VFRFIYIAFLLFAVASAAVADQKARVQVDEPVQIPVAGTSTQLVIARTPGGHGKLVVNRSEKVVEIFDMNLNRLEIIKPWQSVSVAESLRDSSVVAISIGGSDFAYVDFAHGTVATVKSEQENQ